MCAWDRVEAHAAARKLVAIAEVFRRNPEDGFEPEPGQMPAVVHEFTRDQLAMMAASLLTGPASWPGAAGSPTPRASTSTSTASSSAPRR